MIDKRWRTARNILLVRLDNLGDVLLTTPAFHAVKEALPGARLTLCTSPVGAQAGQLNPDIDEIIIYQAPWMDPWHKLPQDSQREQQIITQIKERHFDGAIIFTSFRESPLPAAYLCYLADIPLRLAASIDGPGSLLTSRHKHPEHMMHEVERGLDLVSAIGITTDKQDMVLKVPEHDYIAIAQRLAEFDIDRARPCIVVHPGCSMPARTYPWHMYVKAINLLVQRLQANVFVTGMLDEQPLVDRIMHNISPMYRASVFAMVGLPFAEFCALIQAADLTITNNTGPMHIAAALKTPVVALFALTNPPEQWGPWHVPHRQMYHDVPCRICYQRICPYQQECLQLISPEMVTDAAQSLLEETVRVTMGQDTSQSVRPEEVRR